MPSESRTPRLTNGESLNMVRNRIGERIAELETRMTRLKPVDISAKMAAIRTLAANHGLTALEGLADYATHHAMLPGHRQATRSALDHMDAALASNAPGDRQTVLAAMALRLH